MKSRSNAWSTSSSEKQHPRKMQTNYPHVLEKKNARDNKKENKIKCPRYYFRVKTRTFDFFFGFSCGHSYPEIKPDMLSWSFEKKKWGQPAQ